MKKFYSLLLAATFGVSAFALPVVGNRTAQLTPEAQAQLQTSVMKADAKTNGTILRSWTDKDGALWNAYMIQSGDWPSMFQGLEFQDYPIYRVELDLSCAEKKSDLQLQLFWPARAVLEFFKGWGQTADDPVIFVDWEAAAAKFGSLEAAMAPMPIEDVIEAEINNFETLPKSATPSNVMLGIYGIANIDYGFQMVWDGSAGWYPDEFEYSGDSTTKAGFAVEISDYDEEASSLSIKTSGRIYKDGAAKTYKTPSLNYNGETTLLGFVKTVNTFVPNEVHIFNIGTFDLDAIGADIFLKPFDAVNKFFVCAVNDVATWVNEDGSPAQTTQGVLWDEFTTPCSQMGQGMPARLSMDGKLSYIRAAFYAEEGAETAQGVWSLDKEMTLENVGGSWTTFDTPVPYQLVEGGWVATVSDYEGLRGAIDNFSIYPTANDVTKIGIGDKTKGFNGSILDQYGNTDVWSYTGKIYYHNNPEDYTEFTMIDAIGTGDCDATGVESIVNDSNAPVVATEYYNFQGQRLQSAPVNGLYIVKSVKADGSFTTSKIAK